MAPGPEACHAWKGDGDLSAARPERFQRVDGAFRLVVEVSDGAARWPCRFEIKRVNVEGKERLGRVVSQR